MRLPDRAAAPVAAVARVVRAMAVALLAACAMLATALTAPAAAATEAISGGVALTPGLVERDLTARTLDLAFTVSNHEPAAVRIDLSVTALTHDVDGVPVYGDAVPEVRVEPAELELAPGQRGAVRLVGELADGQPGMYAALLAEPRRIGAGPNGQMRTRVASLLLLRGPGDAARTVEVADLQLRATGAAGEYRVRALLRNTGEVHVRPSGIVRLSDMDGTALGEAVLTGAAILPGAARLLDGGTWTVVGEPPAQVRLEAIIDEPAATGERVITLSEVPEEPAAAGDDATATVPAAPTGPGWPVGLAVALLLLTTMLLLWHSRRLWRDRRGGRALHTAAR